MIVPALCHHRKSAVLNIFEDLGKTKICQEQPPIGVKEYIARVEVTVNNTLGIAKSSSAAAELMI